MCVDFEIIQEWISAGSRVLDLDCGDGELLAWLRDHKQASGYGLETSPDNIARCVENGVNVIEQDLDKGLNNLVGGSLNVVVMTQALQAVHYPDKVPEEIPRVGKTCIITFPNFGHWHCRWYLACDSRMPISELLPCTWYNTPNIHFCIFRDLERLCRQLRMRVLDHLAVGRDRRHDWASRLRPNLLGEVRIYRVTGPGVRTHGLAIQEHVRLRARAGHSSAHPRENTAETG